MQSTILRWCAATVSLAMMASEAGADAIPSYTATDLGSTSLNGPPGVAFSDTGANGTLTAPSGAVYAFPRTDNLVSNPQSLLAEFPPMTNAPVYSQLTYGDPNNAYSYLTGNVFLNQAGQFAATDLVGVAGHFASSESIVYTATQQANGTFSPLQQRWISPNNIYTGGQIAQMIDLNNTGQALGVNSVYGANPDSRDFFLYNLNTGVRTEMASLLPAGWTLGLPIALDDQGRILVSAESAATNWNNTELFLLTPAGLSSNPLATPEPTMFVTLAVAGIGLVVRRRWKS